MSEATLPPVDTAAFARQLLDALRVRLSDDRRVHLETAIERVGGGLDSTQFSATLSKVSRFLPYGALEPTVTEVQALTEAGGGIDMERWRLREAARVLLILALPNLAESEGAALVEDACRYADEGELRALMRSLQLLPAPERFLWRAGEGCRTNMLGVFEATACDTPYPVRHFDETAWKQLLLKCLFVGAPLARVHGIDTRLSMDLARMALDYADERRSAGREIPPELWVLLGPNGGVRSVHALVTELGAGTRAARLGALLGLARAGASGPLEAGLAAEQDDEIVRLTHRLIAGGPDSPEGPRPGAGCFRSVLELAQVS